ncbi:hypothetical protein NPIL_96281, partial [Nephila pilipes]
MFDPGRILQVVQTVVVPEKINAVRELIKQDRHVTYCEIEASLTL